jgi:hypothetical protein
MKTLYALLLQINVTPDGSTGAAVDSSDVSAVTHLLWIIGLCLSAVGVAMIYREWSMGKPDMEEHVLKWAAGIILLWIILLVVPNMVNW